MQTEIPFFVKKVMIIFTVIGKTFQHDTEKVLLWYGNGKSGLLFMLCLFKSMILKLFCTST